MLFYTKHILQAEAPKLRGPFQTFAGFALLQVGLLDYGQTKRLPEPLRLQYARLVLALNERDELAITDAFRALGIRTEKPPDVHSFSNMAGLMFDTRMPKDRESLNPFTDESEIQKNPVTVSSVGRLRSLFSPFSG